MSDKYKSLKVKELQELLQKAGLPHTGKKEELIERLTKHDESKVLELESLEAEFGNLEDFDETKLDLESLADPDLKSFQPEAKAAAATSTAKTTNDTTATKTATTNNSTTPSKEPATKEGSGFKFTPIVFDKKPTTPPTSGDKTTSQTTTTSTATASTGAAQDKLTTEAERKLERAKRFGVQVDEKTKQEIRAARFGTVKSPASSSPKPRPTPTKPSPAAKSSSASKGIDPEVLRKRAERFGLSDKTAKSPKTTTTLSPEEEEKKRKRAERFGGDANKKTKN